MNVIDRIVKLGRRIDHSAKEVASLLAAVPDIFRSSLDTSYERWSASNGDVSVFADELTEDGWPTPGAVERAERFLLRANNWTDFGWALYGVWSAFRIIRENLVCAATDHVWVDDSYGGPDSGAMAGHCSRCGYSFHHTLY